VIQTESGTIQVPPNSKVLVNNATLHTYPDIWGEDSLEFRPSRWLGKGSTIDNAHLITPARGTYSPWSGGPRVCPGQKMSQVEFVAVFATLFKNGTAEPVLLKGESKKQAQQRLVNLTNDSQPRLTLQMNKPKDLKLRWFRRDAAN
jgi:cytochrome P450